MVKCVYGPDTGRLHGFVICDLSDVLCRIADEIVRCGRLFGKPWELRKRTSLQCPADQRMCQQTNHAGFALCRSDHFRKRRFIMSIGGRTARSFWAGGNVSKRTTHTRRTDSAKSRNQQHGISGRPVATPNKQRDTRHPRRKPLWQITTSVTGRRRLRLISKPARSAAPVHAFVSPYSFGLWILALQQTQSVDDKTCDIFWGSIGCINVAVDGEDASNICVLETYKHYFGFATRLD